MSFSARFIGLLLLSFMIQFGSASAQRANQVPVMDNLLEPTSAEARRASLEARETLFANSPLGGVPVVNIGPAVMSGRVADIDAHAADPSHFMVAYASGGLWVTWNNGQSFDPLFDHENVMTIGDIAVDWDSGTIWLGTGENNSSRSSYAGDGIYKSTDWGSTWTHMGLDGTHRTGRIVIHPDDPNTVWVASVGALYSPSADRGVFKTSDGGETWTKTLFEDERSGAIDLVIDPNNSDILFAATWERERRSWNFVESGPGSGIFKSVDGGDSWSRIENSGFPGGEGAGRIGLAIFPGDSNIMYAALDNQNRREEEESEGEEEEEGLSREDLRDMSKSDFLQLDDESIQEFLSQERFPERYSAAAVREMIESDTIEPVALVEFVDDANAQLFNSPVIGLEVYRSDDAGATWSRTHDEYLDGVYNSYGYYFGEIRVAPEDADQIYAMGVPIIRSDDGGMNWSSIGESHVHSDHQALWMNPNRGGHIINGNDGGLNMSYDAGETWSKLNVPPVGQFYSIQVDNADSYRVYGGLQDNGTWMGPHIYEASYNWYASGRYPYDRLGGGDGMQVQVDTRTNDTVYYGSQFGFYSRINRTTGERISIRPRHELGEKPLRFNWQTPILLSRHNQDIFYYGANRLYRSMDRGADLKAISPDLTHGGQAGDVPYGTLAAIDESPITFGLIYTGSDDGMIHVTRDGGVSWTRIDESLPQNLWVSRVAASSHVESRVYATLNGYRWDHFDSYVYRSDDFGQSWTRIGIDLPAEPVNVIIEDTQNPDLLFVGTDHAVYASLDGGGSFIGLADELPNVAVHDLKIQAREKHLLIGTHGRSIYRADISLIQELDQELMSASVHLYSARDVNYSSSWGTRRAPYSDYAEPSTSFSLWSAQGGSSTIRIEDAEGEVFSEFEVELAVGLNYVPYDLTVSDEESDLKPNGNRYLQAGSYTVRIQSRGGESTTEFNVTENNRGRFREPAPSPDTAYEIKK